MADVGTQWDSASGDSEDFLQRVVDLAEDLLVTLIEAVRERPQVAAALAAAVVGAAIGTALAGVTRPKPRPRPPSALVDVLAGLASAVALEERTKRVSGVATESAKKAARKNPFQMKADDLKNVGALAPIAFQLLQNPVVRGYIRSAIQSQMKKRLD